MAIQAGLDKLELLKILNAGILRVKEEKFMEQLLNEIRIAMDNKLYFVALQAALTIPDICGAIESDNGIATGEKYCRWYDKYAKHRIGHFAMAEDIYLFRCSLLHQGTSIPSPRGKQKATYSKIIFAAPYSDSLTIHNCVNMEVLSIDIEIFCNGLIEAAEDWKSDMKKENNANYNNNVVKTIRYYPDGIPPYIVGIGAIG